MTVKLTTLTYHISCLITILEQLTLLLLSGNLCLLVYLAVFARQDKKTRRFINLICIQYPQFCLHLHCSSLTLLLSLHHSTWHSGSFIPWTRISDESKVFEDMLLATADIANRLEISSQALHAAFTKQLKDITKINR